MDRSVVMVVDDESRMRKLVKDFLTKNGYEVLEAENGAEALDVFYMNAQVDLIILDVMMPVMDGWETVREIRKSSKVPIIMLTARSEERDELQGFSLGVDEYISKPFSPKILVARVGAILRRSGNAGDEKTEVAGISLDKSVDVAASIYPAKRRMATWATFSIVAVSLSSGICASLKKMSLIELGISTALLPIGVSMLNVVKDGTGLGWTLGCTLGWVDVVV